MFRGALLAGILAFAAGCGGGEGSVNGNGNGQSGCTPDSCDSLGFDCGTVPDGCGGTLECGTCPSGETCGGAGPNVCGDGTCTAITCASAGAECGHISDGCGSLLECGDCTSGEQCGLHVPNVCGEGACQPTTCQAEGAECGSLPDGCGGTLTCGTCEDPAVCGGGVTANVCAMPCPLECPTGYVCDDFGACVGGDQADLRLDVRRADVSGRITFHGATPTDGEACATAGRNAAVIEFLEVEQGYFVEHTLPCGTTDYSFEIPVWSGTYRVRVRSTRYGTDPGASFALRDAAGAALPAAQQWFVVHDALDLTEDAPNVTLDMRHVEVSARITFHGATPTDGEACVTDPSRNAAVIELAEGTHGYYLQHTLPCGTSDYAFTATLWPGSYGARVRSTRYGTENEPGASFALLDADGVTLPANQQWYPIPGTFQLTGGTANLVLDVRHASLSARITFHGATPTDGEACDIDGDRNAALIELHDASGGHFVEHLLPCGTSDYAFATPLWPGTYRVRIRSTRYADDAPGTSFILLDADGVPLPTNRQWTVVHDALEITGDASNVVLDARHASVSGRITFHGTAPSDGAACTTDADRSAAFMELHDAKQGYFFEYAIPCGTASYPFSATVWPGTYQVRLRSSRYADDEPGASFALLEADGTVRPTNQQWTVVHESLDLTEDASDVVLDVRHAAVSARITYQGEVPYDGQACADDPDRYAAFIQLNDADRGYYAEYQLPCGTDYTFDHVVWPGTYHVRIRSSRYGAEEPGANFILLDADGAALPTNQQWYVVHDALDLIADASDLVLDVQQASVSGRITFHGAIPTDGQACADDPSRNAAVLEFLDDRGHYVDHIVPCGTTDYAFATTVWPGDYRIRVRSTNYSGQPGASFALRDESGNLLQQSQQWYVAAAGLQLHATEQTPPPPPPEVAVETFENLAIPANTYSDGSFVGDGDITWHFEEARRTDEGTWGIDGTSMILRGYNTSETDPFQARIYSEPLAGGIDHFSVEMRKAFTGTGVRQVELVVNGSVIEASESFGNFSGEETEVRLFEVTDIGITGDVVIELVAIGAGQITIDNLSWAGLD